MKVAQALAVATIVLAPAVANATMYRLDAVYGGGPQSLGTIGIADSVVASGALNLHRSCSAANVCSVVSPGWDQVTFNLAGHLQGAALGTGGAILDDFRLTFDEFGDVSGGSLLIEGDFAGGDGTMLRGAALGGSGPTFSGIYIPSEPATDTAVTMTFVQQAPAFGQSVPQSVPEPGTWSLLLAGFIGLGGAKVLRR